MTSPNLQNHVALVTGGSRGIGAAVVRSLAGAGAAVVINYRERTDAAQSLVAGIEKQGGRAIATPMLFWRDPSRCRATP